MLKIKERIQNIKEKLATRKNVVKFKDHTSRRFRIALELIRNKTLDEDDIQLICDYEPGIITTLNFIKDKQAKAKIRELNREVLQRDITLLDKNIQEAEEELALLEEEQAQAAAIECFSFEQIQAKREKLAAITKRLLLTQQFLNEYNEIKNTIFPTKKVGRPKKVPEKTMQEQLFEKAVKDKKINKFEELKLEEDIFACVKNLNSDQKQHVYDYIIKMLEAEQQIKEVMS